MFTLSGAKIDLNTANTGSAVGLGSASLPTSVNQQTCQEVRSGRKRKIFELGKCPANDTGSAKRGRRVRQGSDAARLACGMM
jgi:hypothetical protein